MRPTEPRPYRWSREEFHRLGEFDSFAEKSIELIDGEIVEMPAQTPPHSVSLGLTGDSLRTVFGPGFWVRNRAPLGLGPLSEPQPDLAVVPGKPRDCTEHPTTALLVVEVSDTTLSFDQERKASLYAKSNLADYWIVNLVDRQLEVYRNPVPDSSKPLGFGYADVTVFGPGDAVAPLAAPSAQVAVADLLP